MADNILSVKGGGMIGFYTRSLAEVGGADRETARSLLKLSSSSVLLVPGLMYLKGAINADSVPTFSVEETRDTQSQQQGQRQRCFRGFIDQRWPNTSPQTTHNKRVAGSCKPPCFHATDDGHTLSVCGA